MHFHRGSIVKTGALILALAGTFTLQAAVTCTSNAGVTPIVRSEGLTEPTGDLVLACTGGTPTAAGAVVPPVNITLYLNTYATSLVTDSASPNFNEALLLVDEPNTVNNGTQHALLNCGQTGAPDSGPSGPGVCAIVSTGDPTQTYNGLQCNQGFIGTQVPAVKYGCGHPNAFQGRLVPTGPGGAEGNAITFADVPFDPPGAGVRILRFTNLRGNAYLLAGGSILALVDFPAVPVTPVTQTLAVAQPGLVAGPSPIPGESIRITEGFGNAFKDRNVAFTVGNSNTAQPGNANLPGGLPPWTYNGAPTGAGSTAYYPTQVAQNGPGTIYNTEDQFQWQPPAVNGPPSPNPPVSFGIAPVANIGHPLHSGVYAAATGIEHAGVSSQGTRIALRFSGVPASLSVQCHGSGNLQLLSGISPGPAPVSGELFMTSTDANGAGPYTPLASLWTSTATNLVVYEVLYANPFALEFADIQCRVSGPGATGMYPVQVTATLAPFYSTPQAGQATPTTPNPSPTAIPRFFSPNSDEHPAPPFQVMLPGSTTTNLP